MRTIRFDMQKWNEAKISAKLQEIINDLGYFPTAKELSKKHSNLLNAIYRNGVSISEYRKKFGYELESKPHKYWHEWSNLESEIKSKFPDMIQNGLCPNSTSLKQAGIPSHVFQCSIHGGIVEIAKKLGCQLAGCYLSRDGHTLLSTYELILDEYLFSIGLEHNPNGFLVKDRRYRYDQKIQNDIFIEILGYKEDSESSMCVEYKKKWLEKKSLYDSIGVKLIVLEKSFFTKSYHQIEKDLDDLFSSLGFSIEKKFDFDIIELMKNCKTVTEQSILESLKEIEKDIGEFPGSNQLIDLGRFDILNRVRLSGGFRKYRTKMGYDQVKKPNNYYTLDTTLIELTELTKQLGKFPGVKHCSSSLAHGVDKHGGFRKLKSVVLDKLSRA